MTNLSNRSLGTARTRRMASLKCRNSGVDSNCSAFINLPKQACACRAPASSCHSRTRLCLRLRFTGQFIIRQSLADNLRHHNSEALGISEFTVVEPKALFVGIRLKVKRLDTNIRALQRTLK